MHEQQKIIRELGKLEISIICQECHGIRHHRFLPGTGMISDDTEHTIFVSQCLSPLLMILTSSAGGLPASEKILDFA